jgi:nucleoside-diphosphate-sugar epimerase
VRNEDKGVALSSRFHNKISFAVVEDITAPGAFDKVIQNAGPVEYVIHTASPFIRGSSDPENEVLAPAIRGSLEILQSIHRWGPSVKQVVLTSSLASIIGDPSAQGILNEAHWNPVTYEQSLQPAYTYIGSKTLAEKAAWDFMSANSVSNFSLTTINPGLIFGPLLFPPNNGEVVNTSNQAIDELVQGKHSDKVPELIFPLWVDVRDVAYAHLRAIQTETSQNQRFILAKDICIIDDIVRIMRDQFPQLRDRLPMPQDGTKSSPICDSSKSQKTLGVAYRSLDDSIVATTKSLMRRQKV